MIAALFVRKTSHYKAIPGVDCFDESRNALTWAGGCPGVFHPPCRGWGKLSHFAKTKPGELDLAIWSMAMVRKFGGVVEHPKTSRLWSSAGCLGYGMRDDHGGVLIPVYQSWWGHKAPKETCFYVVGAVPVLPQYQPPVMVQSVENMSQAAREVTPMPLALWLVDLARSAVVQ
jgi:hypothetical protein